MFKISLSYSLSIFDFIFTQRTEGDEGSIFISSGSGTSIKASGATKMSTVMLVIGGVNDMCYCQGTATVSGSLTVETGNATFYKDSTIAGCGDCQEEKNIFYNENE